MYLITVHNNDLESGAYATLDRDGTQIVQVFQDESDAILYNTQLEALGFHLGISEIEDENLEKFMGALGLAYSIVEPGEVVIPKIESLQRQIEDNYFS